MKELNKLLGKIDQRIEELDIQNINTSDINLKFDIAARKSELLIVKAEILILNLESKK